MAVGASVSVVWWGYASDDVTKLRSTAYHRAMGGNLPRIYEHRGERHLVAALAT